MTDEMERADERDELADELDFGDELDLGDERSREMRDELRIEHDRQLDDDVRRAEADYLNPRN